VIAALIVTVILPAAGVAILIATDKRA